MGDAEPAAPGYEGERDAAGRRHGSGVATHKNGDVYSGGYKVGLRHGSGKYVFAMGGQYEGGYHSNKKDGDGTMSYPDGSVYKGGWTADKRNGAGVYTYANGDSYDGGWKEGGRHGKGTYFFAAQRCQFFGYWNTGTFAWGTWVFKDGTTFAGKFSDGPIQNQQRPASRHPAAFYHGKGAEEVGRISGGRWAAAEPAPASQLHGLTGAAPRRCTPSLRAAPLLKPTAGRNLDTILSNMTHEIPDQPVLRAKTPAVVCFAGGGGGGGGLAHTGSVPQGGNIVIYGPAGSGRRTQTALIAEKYGAIVISTGELLRKEVADGSELGIAVKKYMDDGAFVPDELVQQALKPVLQDPEVKRKGFVMYGYPRTAGQVAHLISLNVTVHALFVLDFNLGVSKYQLVERCAMRRIDPETGTVYSLSDDEALGTLPDDVSKSHEFCIKNEELCIKNDEFCRSSSG